MNGRTKTIGLLGGMGPAATVDFYRRIVESTDAKRDQDHIHVVVDSYPQVPDRTAFLAGQGEDPTPALIRMAQNLEAAGADLLVMACNTAYAFAPRIAASVGVPLIELPVEAARAIAQQIEGIRQVGLLATTGTVAAGIYQRALSAEGIAALSPDEAMQGRVMEAIYGPQGVKAGADLAAPRALVETAGHSLVKRGAEALLLACTELSVLFGDQASAWPVPVFDAAQVAAERVVGLAGGRVKRRDAASIPGHEAWEE